MADKDQSNSWIVDSCSCEPPGAVIMEFTDIDEHGVQVYSTAMLPEDAIKFAEAIVEQANWLQEAMDDN